MKNKTSAPESWAYETLYGFKDNARRWFTAWLITFICLVMSFLYIGYLLSDIQVVDTDNTQEIKDVDTIENSTIKNGG